MPIYKMKGKKDGKQKYRVRINYKDVSGEDKQIDRVAYGYDEAKQLYDEYVQAKQYEVRETSLEKSKQILSLHVIPLLGSRQIGRPTPKALQEWKLCIEEKGLSFVRRKNIYGEFRAMLNYGVKIGYLAANSLVKVGNLKDAYETKKSIDFYTKDDFQKFKAASHRAAEKAGFFEWNYYLFFCIAFYTGLRKGEIYALRWSDIEGDILHVRRSIAQKLKGGDRETPPKNKSSFRSLQIPAPLALALAAHKQRYMAATESFTEDWRICGGLRCIRDSTVEKRNAAYALAAGVKKIRIHDFRHSHASLLANEGINIQEIARRLGHSKIEITWNTYSHLYPREEERAVKILNAVA